MLARRRRDQRPRLGRRGVQAALERVERQPAVDQDHQLAVQHDPVRELPYGGLRDVSQIVALPRPQPPVPPDRTIATRLVD
ncbi:hypothetical protein OHB24_17270 [Kribbella sp. NBC_00482]|uniref:hypothetical protein n=1 Tax=Kribbella sp. NBC_00482 TaxID=2975968 RepID=UPI002E194267